MEERLKSPKDQAIDKACNEWGSVYMARALGTLGLLSKSDCADVVTGTDQDEGESRVKMSGYIVASVEAPPSILDKGVAVLEYIRSDAKYDADFDKYQRGPRVSVLQSPVIDTKLIVDSVLVELGWAPVSVALMMHCYPNAGRYVPNRGDHYDEEEPEASFSTEGMDGLFGRIHSSELRRCHVTTLRTLHRRLRYEIGRKLGRSAYAEPKATAGAVRWTSLAPIMAGDYFHRTQESPEPVLRTVFECKGLIVTRLDRKAADVTEVKAMGGEWSTLPELVKA